MIRRSEMGLGLLGPSCSGWQCSSLRAHKRELRRRSRSGRSSTANVERSRGALEIQRGAVINHSRRSGPADGGRYVRESWRGRRALDEELAATDWA
jgi:hypothetical protein